MCLNLFAVDPRRRSSVILIAYIFKTGKLLGGLLCTTMPAALSSKNMHLRGCKYIHLGSSATSFFPEDIQVSIKFPKSFLSERRRLLLGFWNDSGVQVIEEATDG